MPYKVNEKEIIPRFFAAWSGLNLAPNLDRVQKMK